MQGPIRLPPAPRCATPPTQGYGCTAATWSASGLSGGAAANSVGRCTLRGCRSSASDSCHSDTGGSFADCIFTLPGHAGDGLGERCKSAAAVGASGQIVRRSWNCESRMETPTPPGTRPSRWLRRIPLDGAGEQARERVLQRRDPGLPARHDRAGPRERLRSPARRDPRHPPAAAQSPIEMTGLSAVERHLLFATRSGNGPREGEPVHLFTRWCVGREALVNGVAAGEPDVPRGTPQEDLVGALRDGPLLDGLVPVGEGARVETEGELRAPSRQERDLKEPLELARWFPGPGGNPT